MTITLKIKNLREQAGLSQEELARRVGISLNAMQSWEYGRVKSAPFETLQKICEVLKCNPGDIISISEQNNKKLVDNKEGDSYDDFVVNKIIDMKDLQQIKARDEGIVTLRVFVTPDERDEILNKCKECGVSMAHALRLLGLAWAKGRAND